MASIGGNSRTGCWTSPFVWPRYGRTPDPEVPLADEAQGTPVLDQSSALAAPCRRFTNIAYRSVNRHNHSMNSYDRFMPELFRIVGGALRLDVKRVRNYTDHLAGKLEREGDHRTARRLRQLLAETDRTLRPAGMSALAIPVDGESRFPLLERAPPLGQPVILSPRAWEVIREFISVAKSHAILEAEGVNSPLSLMLHGPPGCGKTLLANHIAQDLDLQMFTAPARWTHLVLLGQYLKEHPGPLSVRKRTSLCPFLRRVRCDREAARRHARAR